MTLHVLRWPFALDPLMAEAKRRARRRKVLVAVVALALVGGGAGVVFALSPASSLTPASKAIHMSAIESAWRAKLRLGARLNPGERFPSPPKVVLLRRLRLAASRYQFNVVSVQVAHPRQAAPFVVVETNDEHSLSASVPAILRLIDPKARTNDDASGWAYEGFLFEARNANGVPFLATYDWWRNPSSAGGGQAAASESLYPFAHG